MKTVTDNLGRKWEITVNITNIQRVREYTGVDLTKLVAIDKEGKIDSEKSAINILADDPVKLMMVIWTLCEKQAEARRISAEEFFNAFAGDAIPAANFALLEETADFFPAAQRQSIMRYISLIRRCGDTIEKNCAELWNDPRYDEFLVQQIEATVNREVKALKESWNSPTSSPEQSESTPAPAH